VLAELLHSRLKRGSHIASFDETSVEGLHKFGSTTVVYIPEGEKEGGCASAEEAALEAEELVASGDKVHARGAAAERDVARGEAHLVEIVEVEVAIAEANAGEHGIVLAVGAVGGNVD
jgi:hypothetical protein